MKKLCLIMVLLLLLSGCGAEQTMETVADEIVLNVSAQPREVLLTLPKETLLPAMETESGTLYLCDGYDVAVQILDSGDLDATIRQVSGFGRDDLTVIQTSAGELARYEFVWTAATDLGEAVCRGMILDDGNYHYVLTAAVPAKKVDEYKEIWNGIFESFSIV